MLMRNRWILTALLLCAIVGLTLGNTLFTLNKKPQGKVEILIVTKTSDPNIGFWQAVAAGAKVAAKEFGAEVSIVGPRADNDMESQINILNTMVNYGPLPQVVIIAPIEAGKLVPVAQKIKKAGLSLIAIESEMKDNLADIFIATDNLAAGKKASQAAADILKAPSRIAILNTNKNSSLYAEREQGARQELAKHPGIEIAGAYYTNDEEDKAYRMTKQLLGSKQPVDCILALSETATLGSARAVKELGSSGKIKIVGFDSSIAEIRLLEENDIQALIVQKPFNIGYLGVKKSVQLVRNSDGVESHIDTGSEIITQDNMYTDNNQKMLFPFGG